MENQYNFENKQILITGASSGIGKATAIMLNKLGANVILVSSNIDKLNQTAGLLRKNSFNIYQHNLADVENIEPLIKTIIKECGPLDGFVHSAGTGAVRPLNLTKYNFMINVMNINFFSFVEIARCITKKNAFNPGLNIVGVSAIGAYLGNSTKTAYSASKAAMNASVRCLAKELSKKNIRVNTVAPGVTNTQMLDSISNLNINNDAYNAIVDRQYLGVCEPEDIADTIIFLLSNNSKMITGSCIAVDGGKLTS